MAMNMAEETGAHRQGQGKRRQVKHQLRAKVIMGKIAASHGREMGQRVQEQRRMLGRLRNMPSSKSTPGGSREALTLAMGTDAYLLLVHEHRIAGPELPGI